MYKVVLTRAVSDWGLEYLQRFAELDVVGTRLKSELLPRCKGADAILCRGIDGMSEEFFREAKACGVKAVATHGTGLDGIDLDAATRYGIPVVYAPGANSRSVAEYTVMLMLAAVKEIVLTNEVSHAADLSGRWNYRTREFKGMKVYVIGFGNIGRQVAQMCQGLGMQVAAYDKYMPRDKIEAMGCEYCENLMDGVPDADIVTIHTPLTEETKRIAGKAMFDMMKTGAYFINTARPDLMDENALCDALESGKLSGAAMDAWSIDGGNPNPRMMANKKIVLSYHVAAMTNEAMDAMAKDCADGIEAVLNHHRAPKTANPQVYEKLGW